MWSSFSDCVDVMPLFIGNNIESALALALVSKSYNNQINKHFFEPLLKSKYEQLNNLNYIKHTELNRRSVLFTHRRTDFDCSVDIYLIDLFKSISIWHDTIFSFTDPIKFDYKYVRLALV